MTTLRNLSKHDRKLVGRRMHRFQTLFNRLLRPNYPEYTHYTSKLIFPERIEVIRDGQDRFDLSLAASPSLYVQARNHIRVHSSVLLGPRVSLVSTNHDPKNLDKFLDTRSPSIIIQKNVWVGANAIILPNVEIGENAIVAAGSIVTRDVPDNTTVAGIPAKPRRHP